MKNLFLLLVISSMTWMCTAVWAASDDPAWQIDENDVQCSDLINNQMKSLHYSSVDLSANSARYLNFNGNPEGTPQEEVSSQESAKQKLQAETHQQLDSLKNEPVKLTDAKEVAQENPNLARIEAGKAFIIENFLPKALDKSIPYNDRETMVPRPNVFGGFDFFARYYEDGEDVGFLFKVSEVENRRNCYKIRIEYDEYKGGRVSVYVQGPHSSVFNDGLIKSGVKAVFNLEGKLLSGDKRVLTRMILAIEKSQELKEKHYEK